MWLTFQPLASKRVIYWNRIHHYHPSRLAEEHGFDAVNLDVDYALAHGPDKVLELMDKHGLQPAAFRFPIKLTDEADFIGEG